MYQRIRALQTFYLKYECTILAIFGILLVGIGSYIFGLLHGAALQTPPLRIVTHNPQELRALCARQDSDQSETQTKDAHAQQECVYVGSIHGTKYYPPNCKSVKRIKKENLTCFVSREDAQAKGYAPAASCLNK